jgi:hypothetical protein
MEGHDHIVPCPPAVYVTSSGHQPSRRFVHSFTPCRSRHRSGRYTVISCSVNTRKKHAAGPRHRHKPQIFLSCSKDTLYAPHRSTLLMPQVGMPAPLNALPQLQASPSTVYPVGGLARAPFRDRKYPLRPYIRVALVVLVRCCCS